MRADIYLGAGRANGRVMAGHASDCTGRFRQVRMLLAAPQYGCRPHVLTRGKNAGC